MLEGLHRAEVVDVINLPEYRDLRLHKSLRSSTGYKNVVHMPTGPQGKPYACFSVRDPKTSQKRVLGCYRTAVEAAVVFAKHIKLLIFGVTSTIRFLHLIEFCRRSLSSLKRALSGPVIGQIINICLCLQFYKT